MTGNRSVRCTSLQRGINTNIRQVLRQLAWGGMQGVPAKYVTVIGVNALREKNEERYLHIWPILKTEGATSLERLKNCELLLQV